MNILVTPPRPPPSAHRIHRIDAAFPHANTHSGNMSVNKIYRLYLSRFNNNNTNTHWMGDVTDWKKNVCALGTKRERERERDRRWTEWKFSSNAQSIKSHRYSICCLCTIIIKRKSFTVCKVAVSCFCPKIFHIFDTHTHSLEPKKRKTKLEHKKKCLWTIRNCYLSKHQNTYTYHTIFYFMRNSFSRPLELRRINVSKARINRFYGLICLHLIRIIVDFSTHRFVPIYLFLCLSLARRRSWLIHNLYSNVWAHVKIALPIWNFKL